MQRSDNVCTSEHPSSVVTSDPCTYLTSLMDYMPFDPNSDDNTLHYAFGDWAQFLEFKEQISDAELMDVMQHGIIFNDVLIQHITYGRCAVTLIS
jgi:hypothetical protein